jgi:hypothetical protein
MGNELVCEPTWLALFGFLVMVGVFALGVVKVFEIAIACAKMAGILQW